MGDSNFGEKVSFKSYASLESNSRDYLIPTYEMAKSSEIYMENTAEVWKSFHNGHRRDGLGD